MLNAHERPPGKGAPKACLQHLVKRSKAERTEAEAPDPHREDSTLEINRRVAPSPTRSDAQSQPAAAKTAQREVENAPGRAIEPLQIVDGDHHRGCPRKQP